MYNYVQKGSSRPKAKRHHQKGDRTMVPTVCTCVRSCLVFIHFNSKSIEKFRTRSKHFCVVFVGWRGMSGFISQLLSPMRGKDKILDSEFRTACTAGWIQRASQATKTCFTWHLNMPPMILDASKWKKANERISPKHYNTAEAIANNNIPREIQSNGSSIIIIQPIHEKKIVQQSAIRRGREKVPVSSWCQDEP